VVFAYPSAEQERFFVVTNDDGRLEGIGCSRFTPRVFVNISQRNTISDVVYHIHLHKMLADYVQAAFATVAGNLDDCGVAVMLLSVIPVVCTHRYRNAVFLLRR